jgi:cystathionine beta-synthase
LVKKEKLIFNNVLELVGDTPLVKLNVVTSGFPGSYIAKLDSFNPGHSSKDRIAL